MKKSWSGDLPEMTTGVRLGHFQIIRRIGGGETSLLYKARDLRLGRIVAIKVLPPMLATCSPIRERFICEACCTSALNHPNIVTLHDIGNNDGVPFIVMEYVRGSTLATRLRCAGDIPLPQKLTYAIQMAEGLAQAHKAGIIHRDLKPDNVLITPENLVKVVDFGIAKPEDREDRNSFADATASGAILGTIAYMSPEQLRGDPLDKRSDMFSFGVILWELFAGVHPFRRHSWADTLAAILYGGLPALANPLPLPLLRIFLRCLAKERRERFRSMDLVARDLHSAREILASSIGHGYFKEDLVIRIPGTSETQSGRSLERRFRRKR